MKRSDAIAHIFLTAIGMVLSLMAFKLGLGAMSDQGPGFLLHWRYPIAVKSF
jgi:hypothetical protein